MKIDLTANMKSMSEFANDFRPEDVTKVFGGKSLLFYSVGNVSLADRYEISNFLLDRGVDAAGVSPDGYGVLHVLLNQVRHDIPETAHLSGRILAAGADINLPDAKQRLPIQGILGMKATDDDLACLLDLWFARDDLDLTTKNAWGLSPLDLAKKVPHRESVVVRMERYLRDH